MTRRGYLLTRGGPNGLDYEFLGEEPRIFWWSGLRDLQVVNLNGAEVIVHGDGNALGVLLSGIPSARRDAIGTPIRFTLVVDGLQDDPALAARLAWTGLDAGRRARLGERLDAAFSTAMVDAILRRSQDGAPVSRILDGILDKGWDINAPETAVEDSAGRWAGPIGLPAAQQEFLARVAWLAERHFGYAFTSSRLVTEAGARKALDKVPGCGAVLLGGGELQEVVRLGKAEPPRKWWQAPGKRRVALSAAGILVGALIALGIWRLLAR